MHAEIIAIGSELTGGAKLDTNSQWLSLELADAGLPVTTHTTIADDLASTVELFRQAVRRSAVVVVTGGLGPTLDDLTREALAEAAGVSTVLHEPSLEHIKHLFASRGRTMPERNVGQAMIPVGCEPIPNSRGTAPGLWMELPRPDGGLCRFAALPGVPSEMKPMFRDFVVARLPSTGRVIRRYRVNCFGAGESAVEERLGNLTARGQEPDVGITAHEAIITLRITAAGPAVEDCDHQATTAKAMIRERLGDLVYGEEDEQLSDVAIRMLGERGETLAVVETALSGGRLTEWLTAVPDAETVVRGGATLVSVGPTFQWLFETAQPLTAGSDFGSLARRAAEKARVVNDATWGLAVVGTPMRSDDPGTGTIAIVGPDSISTVPYKSFGDPAIDRSRAANTALDLLRRRITRRC